MSAIRNEIPWEISTQDQNVLITIRNLRKWKTKIGFNVFNANNRFEFQDKWNEKNRFVKKKEKKLLCCVSNDFVQKREKNKKNKEYIHKV